MEETLPVELLRRALVSWGLHDADIEPMVPGATGEVYLVTRGDDRAVAKLQYADRDYAESGLRVSEFVAARTDHPVSTPRRTRDGELVVMVDWPEGSGHPLALLDFVPGRQLGPTDAATAAMVGRVCGHVHRILLEADPVAMGITAEPPAPPEPASRQWDLADRSWLHTTAYDLAVVAWERFRDIRYLCGVWDGPDIRVEGDSVGLIDFGHTGWHPLAHVVANRSLASAMHSDARLGEFMEALQSELSLTPDERDALHLYRLINATIYCRWASWQDGLARDAGREARHAAWAQDLCSFIERGLPELGLSVPAAQPR